MAFCLWPMNAAPSVPLNGRQMHNLTIPTHGLLTVKSARGWTKLNNTNRWPKKATNWPSVSNNKPYTTSLCSFITCIFPTHSTPPETNSFSYSFPNLAISSTTSSSSEAYSDSSSLPSASPSHQKRHEAGPETQQPTRPALNPVNHQSSDLN